MTRYEQLLANMTIERMAEIRLNVDREEIYDYDSDDNFEVCGVVYYISTSDGQEFDDYDEALVHEINWLKEEGSI